MSAYRGKFANFFTLLHKNFVRCPLPGGVRSREGRSYEKNAEVIRENYFCPLMGGVRCREGPLIEVPLYKVSEKSNGRISRYFRTYQ